jgi:hypothetical protein
MEAIVPLFPKAWSSRVTQIVLYQGGGVGVTASYFPKEHMLGLFWPAPADSVSKEQGLRELLLALSVVEARGELPTRLSSALRQRHLSEVAPLLSQCLPLVAENAA